MKLTALFGTLVLMTAASNCWAYGSSSSTKSCDKPRFSDFNPPEKSEVPVQSAFSFIASGVSDPNSIKVTVKNQPVEIALDDKGSVYQVTGNLPESLSGTYARIAISADGRNRCKGTGGWLIKIAD